MRVYLLPRAGRRGPLFYAEPVETDGLHPPRRTEPATRSRFERGLRSLKAFLVRRARRAGPRTRGALAWLLRRPTPDEPLLRKLRAAEELVLFHPARMRPDRVQRLWRSYLGKSLRKNGVAALIDLLLAGLSLPLMLLPGPNVFGLWFLWRSGSRALAVLGAHRARTGRLRTRLEALEVLNAPVSRDDLARLDELAATCGLRNLAGFLRRTDRRHRHPHPAAAVPAAASNQASREDS